MVRRGCRPLFRCNPRLYLQPVRFSVATRGCNWLAKVASRLSAATRGCSEFPVATRGCNRLTEVASWLSAATQGCSSRSSLFCCSQLTRRLIKSSPYIVSKGRQVEAIGQLLFIPMMMSHWPGEVDLDSVEGLKEKDKEQLKDTFKMLCQYGVLSRM